MDAMPWTDPAANWDLRSEKQETNRLSNDTVLDAMFTFVTMVTQTTLMSAALFVQFALTCLRNDRLKKI